MAKILGVPTTLEGTPDEAFNYSWNKLKQATEALGPRKAKLGTKVNALARCAHMATIYVSQHVSFSPDQQQELNSLSLTVMRQYC